MNATEWAAWVGASTGVGSLLWNVLWSVYTKRSAGPQLRVTAWANMVTPRGDLRFLAIRVQNIGKGPTTIDNLGFMAFRSGWARWRFRPSKPLAVLADYQGPPLPHKLDSGSEFIARMEQDEKFEAWLLSGHLWCTVYHSSSKRVLRPVLAKIFVGPK